MNTATDGSAVTETPCDQWRREGGGGANFIPCRQLSGSVKKGGKIGVLRGHQAPHNFWGQQNCSPPGRRSPALCRCMWPTQEHSVVPGVRTTKV